ncbi:hypothetical protein [Streptomyces sioyaensis]|uniref:hypothetical protein n=1 Tax=Streptomyces sioyaensis TaxID=67364 RepID=UPI0036E67123
MSGSVFAVLVVLVVLVMREQYADGSYPSDIFAAQDRRHEHPQSVQVMEYTVAATSKTARSG